MQAPRRPARGAQIKENKEKIKLNNQLPYLVGNVVEVLDVQPEDDEEEDGAAVDLDAQRRGKCVVLKTSTRQTIFLPVVGLVDAEKLRPGDLGGGNKARPCQGLCRASGGQPAAGWRSCNRHPSPYIGLCLYLPARRPRRACCQCMSRAHARAAVLRHYFPDRLVCKVLLLCPTSPAGVSLRPARRGSVGTPQRLCPPRACILC